MAGVKEPIQDLLALLAAIQVRNGDGNTVGLYSRVWNNQFKMAREGKIEAFPYPAAFVEFVSFNNLLSIGAGVTSGDITIKIHIGQDFYDAGDGTMDQNLTIYDLKDKIIAALCDVNLTACSRLQRVAENQNNDHDNITEYVIEYTTCFTDSIGSQYDSGAGRYIQSVPPTDVAVTVQKVNDL